MVWNIYYLMGKSPKPLLVGVGLLVAVAVGMVVVTTNNHYRDCMTVGIPSDECMSMAFEESLANLYGSTTFSVFNAFRGE